MKSQEVIKVNVSVNTIALIKDDMTFVLSGINKDGELTSFLNKTYDSLKIYLTYPFNGATLLVKNASSIYDILKPVADFYKNEVYENPEKHGVYGHGIDDLYFELIIIKGNKVELYIGS